MKAKTQVRIGLVTAAVIVASIIITVVVILVASRGNPFDNRWVFILPLILPSAYGLVLTRKNLKLVRVIFRLWCIGWIISFILSFLYRIFLYQIEMDFLWPLFGFPPVLWIKHFLELIFAVPTYIFYYTIYYIIVAIYEWRILHVSFVSCVLCAIGGVTFMVLLWIGVRGLKQIVKAEADQKQ